RVRHPAPPSPPRPIEHPPAGELRRDCRRCAADFERAMRQVETANTAKSRFIATVSHELRTPLNAIIGFSQIIRDDIQRNGNGTALHADFAQEIHDSGLHLMDIINEILELANIESGRRPLALEAVALDSLFDLSIKKAAAAAARAGVTLEVVQRGITLTSDRLLLRQIIDQLLSNAVKFNVRGGWARLSAEAQDGQVVISVADSGLGVAADDLGRVFQPFWQASTAVARDYDGAGLGLTLVKAATEAMGGDVLIDSRPGVGTRVRVALPLRLATIDGTTEAATAA
ncbi:MAG TPA: HAMP domain-containing sensor histidine kinase, partial [Azospirillaceae bacterium]|nr:HAMP domain-containing sensor histidine kinase [Azospirillaceae bacterium]